MKLIRSIKTNIFNKLSTLKYLFTLTSLLALTCCQQSSDNVEFTSNWPDLTRTWAGPEYWANPMQDWQINAGKLECITSGGDRNVYLLTHELGQETGDLEMLVTIGSMEQNLSEGWVGFKIGVAGEFEDYRDNAVRGEGMPVGITHNGQLFIGTIKPNAPTVDLTAESLVLKLNAGPSAEGQYTVVLEVMSKNNEPLATISMDEVSEHWISGGLALVCSAAPPLEVQDQRQEIKYPDWGTEENTQRTGNFRFWFEDWKVSGSKLVHYPQRSFGPVLFTQFTVSENKLKLTAQMPPIGAQDSKVVTLEFLTQNQQWEPSATANIDPLSRTATFSHQLVEGYPDKPYRLHYVMDNEQDYYFEGVIPHEPVDKENLVVAAFTGNNDLGFPNNDLVNSVTQQQPDFLFFSGDQIYEGVGGYGAQRSPLDKAAIDYLRKWYMFGWTYRDLTRRIPSIAIPDDHDVYHGNIWGESGKPASKEGSHHEQQDSGGYKMFPDWVNMVQRTQTSHFPDPYDPAPIQQNIGVYYTNVEYAGISFAIIEDRKFKSAPKGLLPEGKITNGWSQNPDFDPVTQADHPDAIMLGHRQLKFLDWWANNWNTDTWMKVVLSQTIFANVATLPRANSNHDNIVPKLRILEAGEYAPDDVPVSDMDSNGWPQTPRDNALRIIRKAFALHIAGDQHLGSTIQYGIDGYGDAGYAICVPSVSNVWPRRWYPPINPETNSYTGNYKDGFGNHMTVMAVSNPVFTGRKPARLYDRATGYGIVRFNRGNRELSLENWPRDADPSKDKPYDGWPVVVQQQDNFNPPNGAYLPEIRFDGDGEPFVQAIDSNGEIVWSIRLYQESTALKVPEAGNYTLRTSLDQQMKEYKVSTSNNPNNRGEIILEL